MPSAHRCAFLALLAGGVLGATAEKAQAQSLTAQQLLSAPGASSAEWLRALPPVPMSELGPVLPSGPSRAERGLPTELPRIEPFKQEVQEPSRPGQQLRSSRREQPSRVALIRLPESATPLDLERVKRELGASHARELFYGWYFFELPELQAPTRVRSRLQNLAMDLIYVPDEPSEAQVVWNDPMLSTGYYWPQNQWYLYNVGQRSSITGSPYDYDLDADEAWDVTLAAHSRGQFYYSTVAVADSQVDLNHPDGPAFVGACSFLDNQYDTNCGPPEAGRSHGTAVAGLIGARSGDGYGMSGVSWANRILALNISLPSDPEHRFSAYKLISAIDYATRFGAHIISYSGSSRYDFQNNDQDALYAAIRRAGERDILMVVSAGNDNLNLDCGNASCKVAPAGMNLNNLWTVAAVDDRFDRSYFYTEPNGTVHASNYGAQSADSAAFGSDSYPGGGTELVSLAPGGGYAPFNGTSAAAPLVSGVAGLIKSLRPQATPYVYQSCFGYTTAPALNGLVRFPGVVNAKIAADCALSFGEQTPPPVFDVSTPVHGARVNRSVSLSWQSAPDFYVNYDVFLDGQFLGRTSGTWWPLTQVAEGTHRWYIRAVDAYGNWRNSIHENTFVLDSVAPVAATLTLPAYGQYVNTARPALRWNHATDAGGISGYTVIMDGTTITGVGGAAGYNWPSALKEGYHFWRVTACDPAQNCTTSSTSTFWVDTVFPSQPTPSSPAHQATVTTRRPTLTWAASTDASGVFYWVRLDSGAERQTYSTQYTPTVDLAEGAHTWSVRACDSANNCTGSTTLTFYVHTSGPNPTAPVLLAPRGGTSASTPRPTFSWSPATDDVGITSYRLWVDGGTPVTVSGATTRYTSSVALAEGAHSWKLAACDAEGHCTESAPAPFTLDFQPPTAPTLLYPSPGEERWETYFHSFQWDPSTDTQGVLSYELVLDGQGYSVPASQTEFWLEQELYIGEHTWFVRACDRAYNCTDSQSSPFTITGYSSVRGEASR